MLTQQRRDPLDRFGIIKALDELHEEIYRRGGVKPTNAAIDELCKFMFLKYHLETDPDFVLSTGLPRGRKFSDIFDPTYVRLQQEKAIAELKDAFREISSLAKYRVGSVNQTAETIFPFDEPLRLDNSDVVSSVIATLESVSLARSINSMPRSTNVPITDLPGLAFDVFLRGKYDNAGGLATYLTPNEIVDCMVRMAFVDTSDAEIFQTREPKENQEPSFLIGDISCGTGRFLVSALNELTNRILASEMFSIDERYKWLGKVATSCLVGADQAYSSLIKARINLLMYGLNHTRVFHTEDSITDPVLDQLEGKIRLILTNPPFGEGKYNDQSGMRRFLDARKDWDVSGVNGNRRGGEAPATEPAILFLERNLQLLAPGGRLMIVLPDGMINSEKYRFFREHLLRKADLLAVVSLPKQSFAMAGTAAKTSFIYLQKKSPGAKVRNCVFMAVASHVGFLKKGTLMVNDSFGNDLEKISREYESFISSSLDGKKISEPSELSSRPMVMAIPRSALQRNWDPSAHGPERIRARESVLSLYPNCSRLGDLVGVRDDPLEYRTKKTSYFVSVLHVDERSNVNWIAAAKHSPTSKGARCSPGDILFSCINPSTPRITVIPDNVRGDILCSSEFAVLQTRGEDPYLVALALASDATTRQIVPLARGTSSSRRRVMLGDLLDVVIPLPPLERRLQFARRFREAIDTARTSAGIASSLFADFASVIGKEVE